MAHLCLRGEDDAMGGETEAWDNVPRQIRNLPASAMIHDASREILQLPRQAAEAGLKARSYSPAHGSVIFGWNAAWHVHCRPFKIV